MKCHLLLLVALVLPASAQTLINTDFSKVDHPAGVAEKNPRATGKLPEGWSDNSGWAKVWVDYASGEEEGRAYLNLNVTKAEDGKVQMMHMLPTLDVEAYYRVTLLARSPTRASVQIGIRDAGPPYQFVWQETPGLTESWKSFSYDFRLGKHSGPVRFFINLEGTGQAHFATLKVERRTKADLANEMKSRAGPVPHNLLKQTTFLLGLPSGWSLNREISDGDEAKLTTIDPALPISGRALRIECEKPFSVISSPFEIAAPLTPHIASFHAKGKANVQLRVLADGRTIAQKSFKNDPDRWSRHSLRFEPGLLVKAFTLQFEAKEDLAIDALMVSADEKLLDYQTQAPVEAAVSIDSPARVAFTKPFINFAAVGQAKQVIYQTLVYDHRGEVVHEDRSRTFTLNGRQLSGGVELMGLPLGPLRVQVTVLPAGKEGPALSPPAELVFYHLRRPRYWGKDAPDSPFGVHTLSTTRHNLMAKSIGINWVRLHDAGTRYIGWRYVEPAKGKWVFDDAPINRYRAAHLKVMGCFSTAPDWATNIDKHRNGYFDQFWRPRSMEDFANYVRMASEHYKGVIDTWDVWNEPWNNEWWHVRYDEEKGKKDLRSGYTTSETPEADFARMVDVCATTARQVDPKIKVLGINSYAGGNGSSWTRGIVDADGLRLPDVYCYHQYTAASNLFPNDAAERGFKAAMNPVGKIDKPVWMTEGSSVRDKIGSGLYFHTYPAGTAKEDILSTSDNLCRFVTSLLANGVSKIFLYSMHSHRTFGDGSEWRVLVTEEGYLHPSAAAFSNLAWHLEDTAFVKRIELSPKLNAYLFETRDRTRSVAVLSPVPGTGPQALPNVDTPMEDLFGNPIRNRKTPVTTLVYIPINATSDKLEALLMAR